LNVLLIGPIAAVGSSAECFRIMDIIIYFVEIQVLDGSIDAAPERAVSLAV
jgi:hypothetical protein